MKIWRWLAVIFAIALLAAYGYLGADYLKQKGQTKSLTAQTQSLETEFSMIPGVPDNLDQKMAAARAELAAAENAFTGETNGTRIVDTVLRLAEQAGVKGVPLSTRPWATEKISNRDFYVFHLSLEVTDDFQHLQDFFKLLENSELNTMAVNYLKVVRSSADNTSSMTAELDIAVYALTQATPVPAAQ